MSDLEFASYEELVDGLKNGGGVASVPMSRLRKAHGVGKLGVNVIRNIEDELAAHGIGVFPELTLNQWDVVRVYQKTSPAGRLIDMVVNVGAKHDQALRDAAGNEHDSVIRKIRELVCG